MSEVIFKSVTDFDELEENIKPVVIKLLQDSFPAAEFDDNSVPAGNCMWLEQEINKDKKEILCFSTISYEMIKGMNYEGVIIHNVCTAENHRRKGYMKLLLKYIKDIVKETFDEKFVYLYVWAWNENALNGYKKDGFKQIGDIQEYCVETEKIETHLIFINKTVIN